MANGDDDTSTVQPMSSRGAYAVGAPPLRPPQQPQQQQAQAPANPHGDWLDWLGKPDNRAALISFGASMLQPTYMGTASQIGASLGAAGETLQNRQKQAMAAEKQASDIDVAQRRAAVRESEAETYRKGQEEGAQERRNRLSWYIRYQNEQNAIQRHNDALDKDVLMSPEDKASKRQPALPGFEEWYMGKQGATTAAQRSPLRMYDRNSPEYAALARIMRDPVARQRHLDGLRAQNPAAADALEKEFPKLR